MGGGWVCTLIMFLTITSANKFLASCWQLSHLKRGWSTFFFGHRNHRDLNRSVFRKKTVSLSFSSLLKCLSLHLELWSHYCLTETVATVVWRNYWIDETERQLQEQHWSTNCTLWNHRIYQRHPIPDFTWHPIKHHYFQCLDHKVISYKQ